MGEKKQRTPDGIIEAGLCDLLSGKPTAEFQKYAPTFPYDLRIVRSDAGGAPILLLVEKNTARLISEQEAAGLLRDFAKHLSGALKDYNVVFWRCVGMVRAWTFQERHLSELPKAVAFKSDPELCMTRLPFDPTPVSSLPELATAAPVFSALLARVSNSDALCMRLGSLFDPSADRKQAVWMSGPQDSGKSDVAWLVEVLSGNSYGVLSNTELQTPFWKSQLVGKRVGVVNEAATRFIRSDEFKAITGDDEHAINQKNQPIYNAKLLVLLFFFSNSPPEIPHDDALMLRIIDCRITAIPPEKQLQRHLIRASLTEELPHIAGYCLQLYRSLGDSGRRIPCERGDLTDTVDRYEATYIDFIESHFIADPDGYVLRREFYEVMMTDGIKRGEDQHHCKRVLFSRFSCTEVRQSFDTNKTTDQAVTSSPGEEEEEGEPGFVKKRVFVIRGIRMRQETEKQFRVTGKPSKLREETPTGRGQPRVLSAVPAKR